MGTPQFLSLFMQQNTLKELFSQAVYLLLSEKPIHADAVRPISFETLYDALSRILQTEAPFKQEYSNATTASVNTWHNRSGTHLCGFCKKSYSLVKHARKS